MLCCRPILVLVLGTVMLAMAAQPVPTAMAQIGAPVSGSLSRRAAPQPDPAPVLNPTSDGPITTAVVTARENERFWAWDFHLERYYVVDATLRHVSPTAWIYSEDGADVSGLAVARLAETFEDSVLPVLRDRFGPEPSPGIDGQSAVTLLMLDVRDDLYHDQAPHTYVSGYFDPANQHPQNAPDAETEPPEDGQASNGREMVYLDVAPTDAEGPIIGQTVAHEFAHLVAWAHDPEEEAWLSEGLAQLAIHLCGLGHPREQIQAFLAAPETPLLEWRGEVRDYGKTYLWMLYLYEQLDGGEGGALTQWVRDPADGMASVLAGAAAPRSPSALLRDFGMALHFDDREHGDGRFGFHALDIDAGAAADGDTFAPPAARVHERGSTSADRAPETLAPWTVRADVFAATGASQEIVLAPSGPVCVGGGWREAGGRGRADRFEATCLEGEHPAGWLLRSSGDAGVMGIRTVTAHVGDADIDLRAYVVPRAGTQSHAPKVYLPLALSR